MSRAGAKRKFKGTTPGGRQNMHRLADDALAAQQPHRAWLPQDKRLDDKASTPLGGLHLIGIITEDQYRAGEKYRKIVSQYCSSIGIPLNGANCSPKGYVCMGDRNCDPCECGRRKDVWNEAVAVVTNVSQRAARAVAHVAVYEHTCPRGDIEHLRWGLTALAKHFGIDTQDKVLQTRNAC